MQTEVEQPGHAGSAGSGTITISRVSAALGALVAGVDLRAPLTDDEFAAIHDALVEHQVLFFRDQDLDDDQQRGFASHFGTLGVFPVARMMGSDRDMSYIEDTPDSPPDADGWHTDISWVVEPPKIAVLNARIIPEYGGDTMWASLFGAYDALSPAMQAICNDLTVVHHAGPKFLEAIGRSVGAEVAARIEREFPPAEHPLVRTHPVSGRRALYVSGFMDHIVGMHRDESDALLGYLNSLIDDPNLQVRWHWRAFDLVVWDEASTNHRALSDHYPQHRKMRRCTIDGDRPFFRRELTALPAAWRCRYVARMPRRALVEASEVLAQRDPLLAAVIATVGPPEIRPSRPKRTHFAELARAICYQQLAGAAAAAIHGRFEALFDGAPTPEAVLAAPVESLRSVGLSGSKTVSIRDLSQHVVDGDVLLDRVGRLTDDEIVRELTLVRGIGRWTAEMFLIFQLGRLDVWPVDDFGVRKGYGRIYALPDAPKPRALDELGEVFRPYRSVAAWYCWRATELPELG